MKKNIFAIMICVMLSIPVVVNAEVEPPSSLEAPVSFNVEKSDHPDILNMRFVIPDSVIKLIKEECDIYYEFDWKINDGPWHFNKSWGAFTTDRLWDSYEEEDSAINYLNNIGHDENNVINIIALNTQLNIDTFHLQSDTYYFRSRNVYEYEAEDESGTSGYKHVVSPYVEASIGKKGTSQVATSLEAPINLAGELKFKEGGYPYFNFTWEVPASVSATNKLTEVWSYIDWKIGDGRWATESGELPFNNPHLGYSMEADPVDRGGIGEIDIKANTYYFRKYFEFAKPDGTYVRSAFSNIISIGTPGFYDKASTWAEPELQKASDLGLIPDILMGADMTKPITREEFCELSVLLYEKVTDKTAEAATPNSFTDTNNGQVLKAFKLGITSGTSATTFSPKVLINREQCAAMLFRAIKAIQPEGDYSSVGVKDFPDQKYISSWAVEPTKYMSKIGIITGDSKGNFMPKATTTAQEASKYGMATREQAIAMAVRTYDKQK